MDLWLTHMRKALGEEQVEGREGPAKFGVLIRRSRGAVEQAVIDRGEIDPLFALSTLLSAQEVDLNGLHYMEGVLCPLVSVWFGPMRNPCRRLERGLTGSSE